MYAMPKVKIKEELVLLIEQSLEFIVESHEEVTVYESDGEGGEKKEGSTFLKLTGVFQKGNVPNGNNRIYKTELLVREVDKFQTRINQGLAMGKVYHPGFWDVGGAAGVTDVSHRITKLWMDGDIVRGELLVFKTISGKEVEAITDGGGVIGISSRGYGSMEFYNKFEIAGKTYKDVYSVKDNYHLETFDLVLSPSVKTAFMKPVKKKENESIENVDKGCNETKITDENKLKGGNKPMTMEEFRAQHPEIYLKVHDAAVKEGKEIGIKDLKAELAKEHKIAIESKDTEITALGKDKITLTAENDTLKKENKEYKEKVTKAESEKLAVDIKAAVKDTFEKSEFKSYFKESDVDHVLSLATTVEDAKKEATSRVAAVKSTIETFKSTNTVVESKSKDPDTSEANSDNGNNKDTKADEAKFKADQRAASGF